MEQEPSTEMMHDGQVIGEVPQVNDANPVSAESQVSEASRVTADAPATESAPVADAPPVTESPAPTEAPLIDEAPPMTSPPPVAEVSPTAPASTYAPVRTEEPSSWAFGWIMFAGLMMVLGGTWWLTTGIIALVNKNFFVVANNYVFKFDATTWGWIHLGVGAVAVLAGCFLFTGALWARITAIGIAALAAIAAFAWIPWYPAFAVLLVAVSAVSIWALIAHGSEMSDL